jgi:transcriptional regulator with XRE-family HTH domain
MTEDFDNRVMRQLGRRIKRRRNFLELSQESLAERADLHRTLISSYENGERMPFTSTLIKLAAALGISTGRLVVGIEWEVVAGPPLRDPRADDPWDPRQDDDGVAEET